MPACAPASRGAAAAGKGAVSRRGAIPAGAPKGERRAVKPVATVWFTARCAFIQYMQPASQFYVHDLLSQMRACSRRGAVLRHGQAATAAIAAELCNSQTGLLLEIQRLTV